MRGNPNCYDNWANSTGDPTWKYDNVLPYFKKSLDYHGQFAENSENFNELFNYSSKLKKYSSVLTFADE